MVRIACHLSELDKTIQIANILNQLGYSALNLMQISEISKDDLIQATKKISKSKASIFYFADSLGLNPKQVSKIVQIIKLNWKSDLGIHAHDNLSKAILNTLKQ